MACMQEMFHVNIRQNLQIVIQIATKYSDVLGPVKLMEMFESFKTFEGEHYILRTIVCVFTMPNRPLLLPRVYRQPQRGS
jgi:clathrin heavy chain